MRKEPDTSSARQPRLRRRAATPGTLIAIAVLALVGVGAMVAGSWALSAIDHPSPVVVSEPVASPTPVPTTTVSPGMVEVPTLTGLTLEEAETVLSAAGVAVQVRSENPTVEDGVDTVVDQEPAAGVLADASTTVTLIVRSSAPAPASKAQAAAPKPKKSSPRYVVAIDPGHQARSNSSPEPIGPGSKTVKPKVTGGATGTKTKIPEYEIVLQISMNLKKRLEAQGVKVVMTRTTNDVNLSNSERAAIANRSKADLFVRVHGDGSPDAKASGLSTLYPAKNRWTRSFAPASKKAARYVQQSAVRATGATDRGIKARQDLSGFNYSKVPAILVETGFLSNPVEDRLLASPHYQDKVAAGMAEGIMAYLEQSGKR